MTTPAGALTPPGRLVAGAVSGAVAGVLVAVPAAAAEQGWLSWTVHAVVLGAILGLLTGAHRQSLGSSFAVGVLAGLLDWAGWQLTAVPLLAGTIPRWSSGDAAATFDDLIRATLLGAVAGIVLFRATALLRRRSRTAETAPRRPHIVVVGGGFGGLGAGRRLDALLARGLRAEVTVISESNFLLFTPLLVGVASSALEARHVSAPVRAALRHATFLHGRVESVDTTARTLEVAAGNRGRRQVPYDALILAVGGVAHFFDLPGVAEHAFAMKSIDDANRLRDHVLAALEQADREPDAVEQQRLLTFVVAGGGFAGTELIAELYDLVHDVLHYYPRLHDLSPRFMLAHSGDRLLPELPAELGDYARYTLARRGIEFRLGVRVTGADAGSVRLSDDGVVATGTLAWTAGNRPNPLLGSIVAGRTGPLAVDEYLRVPELDGVWAIGDCARIPDTGDPGAFHPPTAQHAIREGKVVADNVAAAITGGRPRPFRFGGLGVLVSLGHRRAAGLVWGRPVSGLAGWVLWRAVYLSKLPGTEKRLRVLADWLLDLGFPRDIALTSSGTATVPATTKDHHV
ncbi:NAD(P)/FAD-dependent oxidoreductase [Nocardia rhamnosiphila]|uniref:NAD(P)/FAD-dependent oxidoreductase n=1 Tax=Nocardia rhamnosiphila TaxID=426716 RepID=UPI00138DDEF6|nr:NAD(P)/FAD-dependent oxidoreductase [Nocardia rhamnosiphila]